ncbi:hypothetical protein XBKQ1_1300001 [Xenorhabdus bovienii str. kraussei Quebec]|uniref:Uncharacterized protein n=1 Tax=Xenorhabdus bovienii str. kraussei Quebec TaxID=1398203 RepID=A0A077PBY6_XENBV|nr:hypothetical protein [Xenorhabdus bovienii]CDH18533.1 hypothetical protein XBKQ1_1300001 [Xenorhabdus bovienii str. kraussei Quebec]
MQNEIGQNVMAIIQHTDIAGAVRQRTDAQMDAIATQVETLAARSRGFAKDIQSAQDDLKKRYGQLQHYFWWLVGGGLLAMMFVTALSAQLFFGQELDRNYSAVVATYQKVDQLEKRFNILEKKLNIATNDYEKLRKK